MSTTVSHLSLQARRDLFIYLLLNWLAVNSSNYITYLLRIMNYLQFFHLIKPLIYSVGLPSQICNRCFITTFYYVPIICRCLPWRWRHFYLRNSDTQIRVLGTRWRSWLRQCPTSRKVAGSIPDGIIWIFHWHNPSGRTVALGSTQPLTEMNTRNISWGIKAAGA